MRLGTMHRRRLAAATAVCGLALAGFIPPAQANPDDTASGIPGLSAVTALPPSNISFPGNDGQPHTVGYDKHSFTIDGERINIWSGEIHYWRAPDVNSWRDLFQKMRAMGYNGVSLYFFWGLHQSEEGAPFDFTPGTIKDLDLLLTLAKQEGLYVIARPGPYVNAEISMGGLPAYMTNYSAGLRSTDPKVLKASTEWLAAFNEIVKKHLITDGGGSVILYQVENELIAEDANRGAFLKALADFVRNDGITVPLFHNDYGLGGRFHDVKRYGTDFYAYDRYPVGFNCSAGRNTIPDLETQFRTYAPETPHFITESQGGAFTPWGARYNASDCYTYTDEAFTRQWGVNNIGNGVTAFNFYMAFGGTNWGWTGSPSSGFTSYDYGAGITEDRQLTPKASVQKEIGYYTKAVPELASMDPVRAPRPTMNAGSEISAYQRQATDKANSATGNGVQVLAFRHRNSNDQTNSTFTVPLSLGQAAAAEEASFSHDDRHEDIHYTGTWVDIDEGGAAKGTLKRTTTVGDSLTFTFTGPGLRIITGTGVDHGAFSVQIDDEQPVTVSTTKVDSEQNKPEQFEAFRVENLSNTQHTLTLRNVGTDQATTVSIDAIDVFAPAATEAVIHNDADESFFTYTGNWSHARGQRWTAGDINGDESFSNTQGDSYSFTFTGVGFDLVAPWSENHGSATVRVDGEVVGQTREETTNGATPQKDIFSWRAEDTSTPAQHTVTVTNDGQPFPRSSGTYTSIDAVRVFPDASALPKENNGFEEGEIAWARVPQKDGTFLTLHGRDALLLTADRTIDGHALYYTTSQLFGAPLTLREGSMQYLLGVVGDAGETVLHYAAEPTVTMPDGVEKHWDEARGELRLNYTHSDTPFSITITPAGENAPAPLTLRVIDRVSAQTTWLLDSQDAEGNPATTAIEGADLARTVRYSGEAVALTGSMNSAKSVMAFLPAGYSSATWNGNALGSADGNIVSAEVAGPQEVIVAPLSFVKAQDHAEAAVDFDDAAWKTITDTVAANPRHQGPGRVAGVVLDSNHHRFYEGSVWYRAHYTAASDDPTLTFTGNGGSGVPSQGRNPAFMQVWVNGAYAGALPAEGRIARVAAPTGSVKAGQPVTVAVLVHNLGQNLDWSDNGLSKQNRGLFDADLRAQGGVTWKISGATSADAADLSRNPSGTLYNNGGLGGEKAGWHMPGFDDSGWTAASDLHSPAGITWYRAKVNLDVPATQDTIFRLNINSSRFERLADNSQVTIFVNGWNTGVYIGNRGPQTSFAVPTAFLNLNGENTIALAVAAQSDTMGPESVTLSAVHSSTVPERKAKTDPAPEPPTPDTPAPGGPDTPGPGDPGAPAPSEPGTPGGPDTSTPQPPNGGNENPAPTPEISGVVAGQEIPHNGTLSVTLSKLPAQAAVTMELRRPKVSGASLLRSVASFFGFRSAEDGLPLSASAVANDEGVARLTLTVPATVEAGAAELAFTVNGKEISPLPVAIVAAQGQDNAGGQAPPPNTGGSTPPPNTGDGQTPPPTKPDTGNNGSGAPDTQGPGNSGTKPSDTATPSDQAKSADPSQTAGAKPAQDSVKNAKAGKGTLASTGAQTLGLSVLIVAALSGGGMMLALRSRQRKS